MSERAEARRTMARWAELWSVVCLLGACGGDAGRAELRQVPSSDDPMGTVAADAEPGVPGQEGVADGASADARVDPVVTKCESIEMKNIGEITEIQDWREYQLGRCVDAFVVGVVPRGTTWRFEWEGLVPGTVVTVHRGRFLDDPVNFVGEALWPGQRAGTDGRVEVSFQPAWGGEVVLALTLPTHEGGAFRLRVTCAGGCDHETTRFPLVLVHGLLGTDTYFNVLEYFYDVREPMRAQGYAVFTPVTDAVNTSEERAAQLGEALDRIFAETGARKVNLIAHSQGGLDARVLAHTAWGSRIATITTVATPHHGIPLNVLRYFSAQDFTEDFMEGTFNVRYPDVPGIRYASWTARTCGFLDFGCRDGNRGAWVDALLATSFTMLSLAVGANDGVVPTASGRWGEHLGELSADHFDEVGQIADPVRSDDPFDHRAFYRDEGRRLFRMGY